MLPPEYVRRDVPAQMAVVDRGRLALLVLEGGHAFLMRARDALERGDLRSFASDLGRTRDVLLEVSQTIDDTPGGDIAASLGRLHQLMVSSLALANAERGLALVDEVLRAYVPIIDRYRQIVTHATTPA